MDENKTVPVTMYYGGKKKEIGTAVVKEDGTVEMVLSADGAREMHIGEWAGHLSISHHCTYTDEEIAQQRIDAAARQSHGLYKNDNLPPIKRLYQNYESEQDYIEELGKDKILDPPTETLEQLARDSEDLDGSQ